MKSLVYRVIVVMGVTILSGVATQSVVAAPAGDEIISRDEAAMRATKRVDGRILSIKLRRDPPPPVYRVKVLKEGSVHVLDVDARRSSQGRGSARSRR